MSTQTQNEKMTGILQIDEKTNRYYIKTDSGTTYPVSPFFDFFNGNIDLENLMNIIEEECTDDDILFFIEQWLKFSNKQYTSTQIFEICKERFNF
jgi:hypothetical protein